MNGRVKPMLALAVLATGLLLIADGATAQPRGRKLDAAGADDGHSQRRQRLIEVLDLSEAQQSAIEKIHDQGASQRLGLRKELMRLRNELQGEMLKDEPQESAVQSLNERIGKLRTQMHASRLKERLDVRQQLTPQQRDKMLMMRERHPAGRGDGRGQGWGPAGPGRDHRRADRCFGDCTGEGPHGPGLCDRGGHECGL